MAGVRACSALNQFQPQFNLIKLFSDPQFGHLLSLDYDVRQRHQGEIISDLVHPEVRINGICVVTECKGQLVVLTGHHVYNYAIVYW